MAQDSAFDLLSVDDFYFSALFDEDREELVPISDDKYAEELQFQETLMASVITSQVAIANDGSLSSSSSSSKAIEASSASGTGTEKVDSKGDSSQTICEICAEIKVESSQTNYRSLSSSSSSSKAIEASSTSGTGKELVDSKGESSETICEICAEIKGSDQMFINQKCDHSFCSDCITKQVATKIQESITIVSCPGLNCRGVLELDACRPMLPRDLLDRWDEALTEALFLKAPKFYCPFKDCSAMLLVDENEGEQSSIRESECPICHRLFCALCNVPWHAGAECEELQRLNEDERGRDDLLVRELANENKWSRCPQCKYYVERISGCPHITCRCQFQFCYGCGEQWTPTHGGCQKN